MDWTLAIEKNHGALKRILAMLVAIVGIGDPRGSGDPERSLSVARPSVLPDISPTRGEISSGTVGDWLISPLVGEMSGRTEGGNVEHCLPRTLPRHLHRFVLRLLRPAEAATRRLIIIAAQGLVVKLPKFREAKPRPKKPLLNRKNGYGTGIVIRPGPLPDWLKALVPKRSPSLSLSLLDPMKRFGVRRRYAKPSAMPQIRVLGGGDPIVPLFRRPEPLPLPLPTLDDPLDAGSIHRRLEVLGRALDDLPKQAMRMARWQARRDARLEREREGNQAGPCSMLPPSVLPDISPTRGEISRVFEAAQLPPCEISGGAEAADLHPCGGDVRPFDSAQDREGQRRAPASPPFLAITKWGRGGEPAGRDGEGVATERDGEGIDWEELGVPPEALALLRRRKNRPAQPNIVTETAKPGRHHRISPIRPGRPPGWRRKANHDVYEVLNELHGLAVWARERRDSS